MRNADTSNWIELRSPQVDQPLLEDGRDARRWSRVTVTIGIVIMSTTTMTLVLYRLYLALGETLTGAPGMRPAVVYIAVIIAMLIGAASIAAGVVLRHLPSRSGTERLEEETPANVTNGHRSDHLVA